MLLRARWVSFMETPSTLHLYKISESYGCLHSELWLVIYSALINIFHYPGAKIGRPSQFFCRKTLSGFIWRVGERWHLYRELISIRIKYWSHSLRFLFRRDLAISRRAYTQEAPLPAGILSKTPSRCPNRGESQTLYALCFYLCAHTCDKVKRIQ